MKSVLLTPNSSLKSTTTIELNQSETRDSYYFPGCRKDASCNCEICIASINSTLDLKSQSNNKSSLTKFYPSKPMTPRSPVSFNRSSVLLSTPKSSVSVRSFSASPPLNSTARTNFQEKIKRRKRDLGYGVFMMRLILGFVMVFAAEYGFSCMVYGFLKPDLSPDIVKNLGEKLWVFEDINERFLFLKNELQGFVDNKVCTCSSVDSVWKINQDGLLLSSRCTLYKSTTEEVSIWGWPLQTAGLLTAEFSSRSFTVISGRVTEWSNGELRYLMRKANSSWTQGKWSANAVQFDPNTWLLEYRQNFLPENARLVTAAMEFLKFRLVREFEKMKQEFWLLFAFGSKFSDFRERSIPVPT
ncbi:C-8 sterol isomerase [Abeliophyllum distichum]|uniref:C-8 sterol isomerase n=1 Tax=Abeliophyllum distichum TaxID=126358 RepID=A0ABD1T2A1_9LAMI